MKTTFLLGEPEGFIVQGQENLVCKLRKSLYGLKQAPRQWYKKFDSFVCRIRFKRFEVDHCCYVKFFDNSCIIFLLYVDDILIAGSSTKKINDLKKQLSKQFVMKDLGVTKKKGVNAFLVLTFCTFFYFGPYILFLPLLIPKPINA